MSIFEQKRNKQVFEIIVILKIIYIILSMIPISSFLKLKSEIKSLILMTMVMIIMKPILTDIILQVIILSISHLIVCR